MDRTERDEIIESIREFHRTEYGKEATELDGLVAVADEYAGTRERELEQTRGYIMRVAKRSF